MKLIGFLMRYITVLSRDTLLIFLFFLSLFVAGCSDSNHSSKEEPITVFATLNAPATADEVELWLADFATRTEQMRLQIITSQSPDWQHDLIPLYDFILDLSDAKAYSSELMNRSPIPEVRALGYMGYGQLPQLQFALTKDPELKEVVELALSQLTADTAKQQVVATHLTDIYASEYTSAEVAAQIEAEGNLTNVSLAYYNNAVTKSASATFTAEEFSCLPEELLAKIPQDSSGNFVFDANNPYLTNLLQSCLDETVRERLHAVSTSKAAAENSLLWPTIQQQRLSYAELFGSDDFASMRLSHAMLGDVAQVWDLLDEVKTITDPAFDRLTQRYIDAQASAEGVAPTTVYAWNSSRYYSVVKEQLLSEKPVNPQLLTFPETFDNMLYLLGKIVGLTFVEIGPLESSWNPEVVEYRVYDQKTNAPVATFLLDPYQVDGVSSPASCSKLMRSRLLNSGAMQVPVVVLHMHLEQSTTATTTMSTYDYKTFGHELGHALHFMLDVSTSSYQDDFNEIPSMFCENLVKKAEFFKAVLSSNPDEPLEQLPEDFVTFWHYYRESSQQFCTQERYQLVLSATAIDLTAWQGGIPTSIAEVGKRNIAQYLFPYSSESQPLYNVSHFVNPATDAYYYQYVLAQVVSMDILSLFETSADSIFDQQLGERYRTHVLENSGPDSGAAITNFLGREWNYDAYQDWFEEKTQDL